jgi:hypothetical protein
VNLHFLVFRAEMRVVSSLVALAPSPHAMFGMRQRPALLFRPASQDEEAPYTREPARDRSSPLFSGASVGDRIRAGLTGLEWRHACGDELTKGPYDGLDALAGFNRRRGRDTTNEVFAEARGVPAIQGVSGEDAIALHDGESYADGCLPGSRAVRDHSHDRTVSAITARTTREGTLR